MYLSLNQALQLVVIAISLLAISHLVISSKRKSFLIVPLFYFVTILSASFVDLFPALQTRAVLKPLNFSLMLLDSSITAASFLLICQFIFKSIPQKQYWYVLVASGVFSIPFIYLMLFKQELCVISDNCFKTISIYYLVRVVVSGTILAVLTVIVSKHNLKIKEKEIYNSHKYWLIISLILFNVLSLIVDLTFAKGSITKQGYVLADTTVTIAFLYLAISSIFRVFSGMFAIEQNEVKATTTTTTTTNKDLTEYELEIAIRAENLLKNDKVYRDLKFNRTQFAILLGIKEHLLSRIIHHKFNKSFSEIANEYRINEAKELLISSADSVTSISFDVGFNSLTSFNRVFKESVGKSPSKFRLDHKEECQKE